MLAYATPEFVAQIMEHPRVWESMCEDGMPPHYVTKPWTVAFRFMDLGVLVFRQITFGGMFEVHIAMLRGSADLPLWCLECLCAMRAAGAKKFLAQIGEWNKACLRLARKCGFVEEGRVSGAFLKHGKRQAMIVMGAV